MRRSKAPSVLKKKKSFCHSSGLHTSDNFQEGVYHSDIYDEHYTWGSRNKNKFEENKRIFNVLWRDASCKKNKTWKGDGSLEYNRVSQKAILKDDTGKYIACSQKINGNELAPDFQTLLGGKEIEIQNEITGEDQLHELRKRQIENHRWVEEGVISASNMVEEEKKPKGGFIFKPILILKNPKVILESKPKLEESYQCFDTSCMVGKLKNRKCLQTNTYSNEPQIGMPNTSSVDFTSLNVATCTEYICFLKPSELQRFLFQKVLEYYSEIKLNQDESLDLEQILKLICNHPSMINQKIITNNLISHLMSLLPDWTEMGPFDSAKLEFLQYYLTDVSRFNAEKCIIFAKSLIVLNMLQGLCNFMNIECLQLDINVEGDVQKEIIKFLSLGKELSCKVVLLNSVKMLSSFNFFEHFKKIIFFEEISNLNIFMFKNVRNIIIYNLITAFTIEELLLSGLNYSDNAGYLLDELLNMENADTSNCYLHSKIGCSCFESSSKITVQDNNFIKNWKHFKIPFEAQLLKNSWLENSSQNIVSIFVKQHDTEN